MMERLTDWTLHKDEGGLPIEKARREAFFYSFILTTEARKPWFIFKIRRALLDDHYRTDTEQATLDLANTDEELKHFISMGVKMQSLGFRSSIEGERYEITQSQFQRFFKVS